MSFEGLFTALGIVVMTMLMIVVMTSLLVWIVLTVILDGWKSWPGGRR